MRSQTAEEFVSNRFELDEDGRWSELILGEPVSLVAPPPKHGTAVLNISKALAEFVQQTMVGYACFELGLIVRRAPDSVYCPPISYFVAGSRWEEMDKQITETRPALVIEIASSRDRRLSIPPRVSQYLEWGVAVVWVVDTESQNVCVHTSSGSAMFELQESLESSPEWVNASCDAPVLEGFRIPVENVFREPEFMK
ncbi:MAG: Uma2 family endonuclease [Planctomycetes bacterium]|nr:Uma2 family endonuclease [Planctomycetota bacterium]